MLSVKADKQEAQSYCHADSTEIETVGDDDFAPGRCLNAPLKLEFHGTDTDTDTDILIDFRARIIARMSACPVTYPFSSPRAGHAR